CQPCHQGCATCQDDKPCLIQEDHALRAAVLSCQAGCMLAVFLSMLVSYHFRRSKARRCTLMSLSLQRIRSSGVILLETILFGSLLLYFPVFILYFKPSIFRCIVLRWVRALGFAIVYGTITLKLHRVSPPAQGDESWCLQAGCARGSPAPDPSSNVCPGMTVLALMLPEAGGSQQAPTPQEQQGDGSGCSALLCPAAEVLFLLWGSFLCYGTRPVPSAFHEPRYMGIALHNELLISAAFHLAR
ncbi:putative G-protein coupled receptor 158, partial [Chaetura pelagica]